MTMRMRLVEGGSSTYGEIKDEYKILIVNALKKG
jgi:hypothetical protein